MKTNFKCVLSTLLLIATAAPCLGEFVLDDFDIEFSLDVPNGGIDQRSPEEWDLDVGELGARRWVSVLDDRDGQPATLTLHGGGTFGSVAHVEVIDIPPRLGGLEYSAFGIYYDFIVPGQACPTCSTAIPRMVDYTENGVNNTVFIDFAYVRGPTPPKTIRLSAFNSNNWAIAAIQGLPATEKPFTLAVPFSEFQDRVFVEGVSLPPDFSKASGFSMAVYSSGLFDIDTYDSDFVERFSIGIDAIRIGTVPEPGLSLPFLLLILVAGRKASRGSWANRSCTSCRQEFTYKNL